MQSALIVIAGSKDLFNFYSCRFKARNSSNQRQKTFLISTLVDKKVLTYTASQKTFLISTLVDDHVSF